MFVRVHNPFAFPVKFTLRDSGAHYTLPTSVHALLPSMDPPSAKQLRLGDNGHLSVNASFTFAQWPQRRTHVPSVVPHSPNANAKSNTPSRKPTARAVPKALAKNGSAAAATAGPSPSNSKPRKRELPSTFPSMGGFTADGGGIVGADGSKAASSLAPSKAKGSHSTTLRPGQSSVSSGPEGSSDPSNETGASSSSSSSSFEGVPEAEVDSGSGISAHITPGGKIVPGGSPGVTARGQSRSSRASPPSDRYPNYAIIRGGAVRPPMTFPFLFVHAPLPHFSIH